MHQSIKFAILFLLLPGLAVAGPKDWVKHHKRFLLMESAAVAGASIHAAGLHHCRRHTGVENCDSDYGAAWATFGVATGFTVIAMPAAAEGCWKNEGGKFCNVLAYGGSQIQTWWGVHEWQVKKNSSH
jgi:hypothetical protein